MSKCEEWWHESGRAEQTVCQLGSPWAIHLPTSSRDADCRSGEDWTGFPPLIAFCREWDKAMPSPSLNLSGMDMATAELLEGEITGHPWQLRQTTRDNTSRDKQHNSVNTVAEMSFHSVKKREKVKLWLLCLHKAMFATWREIEPFISFFSFC